MTTPPPNPKDKDVFSSRLVNDASELNKQAHERDDVDLNVTSHHHTIGDGPNQAASGKTVADLISSLNDDPWHLVGGTNEPAFLNSWVNHSASNLAKFTKRGNEVFVQGIVKNGTVNPIFNLPVGYRPDSLVQFTLPSGTTAGFANVYVDPTTGAVTLNAYGAGGSNGFVYINFSFLAV